jgi:uncharacterized protein (DUF1697 family)
MEELREQINSLGFKNVSTYKQSGNIIFTTSNNPNLINKKIQKKLHKLLEVDVKVFLRTISEVENIVKYHPFKKVKSDTNKFYVTFLPDKLSGKPRLPIKSANGDVEIVSIRNREIYSLTFKKKGRYGYPTSILEKKFDVLVTTRNWATIKGIIEKYLSMF